MISEDIKSGILKEEHYDITDNSELLYPLIANFVRRYKMNIIRNFQDKVFLQLDGLIFY